jgi:hypothetical protein
MQKLLIFQSLWAMERRHTDGIESSVEENISKIHGAGFHGVSSNWVHRTDVLGVSALLKSLGLQAEGVCYPKSVDELVPILELATETGVHHLNIQPNVRPRHLHDCIPILEGWQRLAEQVDFPVYFETHRDRMTTDLYFTLDLLDNFPNLQLVGDLSHFLVAREFGYPISDEDHRYMEMILDRCQAFHGRVASREQIQIEISFSHHKIWVDLFARWWAYGFASWKKRAGIDATLAFSCELGPKPYAITGRDGNDLSDRWHESLLLRDLAQKIWDDVPKSPSAIAP